MIKKIVPRFNYFLEPHTYLKFINLSFCKSDKVESDEFDNLFFLNARSGLKFLLESISGKRTVVGIQLFTCETVFKAIDMAGYSIVFIDLDSDLRLNRKDLIEKKDSFDILIVTHTFGYPDDIDEIRRIVGEEKVIIEDCCHSYLSHFSDGTNTGTKGDAAIFSSGIAKFPPIGIGGYIMLNNRPAFSRFQERLLVLKSQPKCLSNLKSLFTTYLKSLLFKPYIFTSITSDIVKHFSNSVDFTNKHSFQERFAPPWVRSLFFLNVKLFSELAIKQVDNYKLLYELINCKSIIPLYCDLYTINGYLFPIIVNDQSVLYTELNNCGYKVGMHFKNCIRWGIQYGYTIGSCPITEEVTEKIITLPVHPKVSRKQIFSMAAIVNSHKTAPY